MHHILSLSNTVKYEPNTVIYCKNVVYGVTINKGIN